MRVASLAIGVAAVLLTEAARSFYRPFIYANALDDFHVASTVIGAVHLKEPNSIASVPRRASIGRIVMVNVSIGVVTVSRVSGADPDARGAMAVPPSVANVRL